MMLVRDCDSHTGSEIDSRRSPTRNRYYFGKLLDSFHLQLEQSYSNRKRWLLNQLTVGTGTLCGLRVVPSADRRGVQVEPGVAVDGHGREILVTGLSAPVDPTRPTDECGQPAGPPLVRGGIVTLYLCYHECPVEPAPVLVDECGPRESCEFGLIEERYRLQIRAGLPEDTPGDLTPELCRRLFGYSPKESLRRLDSARTELAAGNHGAFLSTLNELRVRRGGELIVNLAPAERTTVLNDERDFWVTARRRRKLLCHFWGLECPTADEPCVPLAVVTVGPDGQVQRIDNCGPRNTIFSNSQLLDLILCLADRVDECCAEPVVMSLAKASGDNQVGVSGQPLAAPLVARVTRDGAVVANEDVFFEALGDSQVGPDLANLGSTFVTPTDANGDATLPAWQLGAGQGSHAVLARIASGSPDQVIFKATGTVQATLPVVRGLWPPPSAVLGPNQNSEWYHRFVKERRLDVTFDRKMDTGQLDTPDSWLGVFAAFPTRDRIVVMRLPLTRVTPPPGGVLPISGVAETYRLNDTDRAGVSVHTALSNSLRAAMDLGGGGGGGAAPAAPGAPPAANAAVMDTSAFITTVSPTGFVDVRRPEGFMRVATVANTPVASSARVITLMKAGGGNILDAQAPNQLLDADFQGALLDPAVLKRLWALGPGATATFTVAEIWDALVDTGRTLPESGDGTEGGSFQAWFELTIKPAG